MEKALAAIQQAAPLLPRAEAQYIAAYVAGNEFSSAEEIKEFFAPLLDISDINAFEQLLLAEQGSKESSVPPLRRLSEPVCPMRLQASLRAPAGPAVDHAHATRRQDVTRVNSRKLEKAELKLKQKLKKRNADYEYSGVTNNRKQVSYGPTEAQIKQILAARGKFSDLHLDNFDISLPSLRILNSARLSLVFGRRYGLVGRNGIGKSTLLRRIVQRDLTGMEKYAHVSIGHLEQELVGDDDTCLESVLKADFYRTYLLNEESELQAQLASGSEDALALQMQLREVNEKMEEIGTSTAPHRAAMVLKGLGFSQEMQEKPTSVFSGGWKMRLALARALFVKPDLLLLDEPTNHLDIPAVVWLSEYLKEWTGTMLVVSHDREFLDEVATDIVYMHDERLDTYRGNFTYFEGTREERRRQAVREYEAQMLYRKGLQDFVDKWRYNAKRAAQAQSKLKILEKLPELEVPTEEVQAKFQFVDPDKVSAPVLQLDEVSFSYSSKAVLRGVNLDVQMTSRIALVGPNGAGKSTVLRLLTGELQPTRGRSFRNSKLSFGFFTQHHVEALEDFELTPVEFLYKHYPGYGEEDYRRHLGSFGISGRVALQKLSVLSGGQKSRVVFASLAIQQPSILVLDEPTNHLDYLSVDALAKALIVFKGGVIVVSHDQRFIEACCNEIWVCDDGQVRKFFGDGIKGYRQSLLSR